MTKKFFVLAVDDEKEELEFVEQALLPNNTIIKGFEDSYSFMKYVKDLNAEVPDLIIMDFNIPKIDGFKLVSFIVRNDRYANTPIVLLTNLISPNEEKRLMHAGVKKIFLKPASIEGYKDLSKEFVRLMEGVEG